MLLRERLPTLQPWRQAATGCVLGVLIALGSRELGARIVPGGASAFLLLIGGALGSLIAGMGARRLLWIAAAAECAALLVISYTPLVPALMRGWVRSDPLETADAVVSLSSEVYPDGSLDDHAQLRLLHAYELLGAGEAPCLVLTHLAWARPSVVPAVRRQMSALGLHFPIHEVGSVRNTHDEALAVARLVRRRGWKRVLLVSDPDHMRRAGAVFTHAGVNVCCSPGPSVGYNLARLDGPGDRLAAFRDWLHEWIGYQVYRWRGWI